RRQLLHLDRLEGIDGKYSLPRAALDSSRVVLFQVNAYGAGSRLVELDRSDFRQRRVLFESRRKQPDYSRARAVAIDHDGVIWLFLDSYDSNGRLCQLVEARGASEPEGRWSCSPVEILGEGDKMRNLFL